MRMLLGAVLLAAVGVTLAGLMQTPTYEASAKLWVGQKEQRDGKIHPIPNYPTPEQQIAPAMVVAIESRPVAEEVIQRRELRMGSQEFLDHLTVEQIEDTEFLLLSYRDNDAVRAEQVVNDVSNVAIERISASDASISGVTVTVWERAVVPEAPISPKPFRNGLLTLVAGLALCAGLAKLAPPGVGARVAGTLGEWPPRLAKLVGQAGVLGRRHRDYSIVERVKEKKLLLALGRRGKLTAIEAALETSLSVEEANRMLFELAAGGHLEVTVEDGKLLYSFWGEAGV